MILAIVIATPHRRHDGLEQRLRDALPEHTILRIRGREELTIETLVRVKPAYVFFPHWSWIIPEEVFAGFECVVFHMTDLPYGRGGSPLQNLIVRGHRETKISALRCVKELDAGPIYLKRPLSLEGTAEEILSRASAIVESMILEIVRSRPIPVEQTGDIVVFKRRRPEDGNLASLADLSTVNDFIRMLDAEGYPPAFLETPYLRLEFGDAKLSDGFLQACVRFLKKPSA